MVLGLLVFAGALIAGAPLWVAVVSGLAVGALAFVLGRGRRRERARRAAERARRRELVKQAKRDERKRAIKARTGLDVDLVARAAQDAVHTVGSRINRKLEARYATPEPPKRQGDWLDLDSDYGALRSKAMTDEALRLNDELGRQAPSDR